MDNLTFCKERNYGIDALKILSMFMIVIWHILGHGGVYEASFDTAYGNYELACLLKALVCCAVNCYALVSGYVYINSKFKITNILMIWLQVVFYSVCITLVFSFVKPDAVSGQDIFRSFFPVMHMDELYWYFNCYFLMFFFIPILNSAIQNLSKKYLGLLLGCIIFISSLVFTIFRTGWFGESTPDIFSMNRGYSVLWLLILYLVGAYIAKYNVFEHVPKTIFLIIYLISAVATFAFRVYGDGGDVLYTYTSPTIFLCGVCLLFLFSRIKIKGIIAKIVSFLSPLTFGVYLLHEHPLMGTAFMNDKYVNYATYHPLLMVLAVLLTAICFYVVCSLIDYLRLLLFKALRIKQGLRRLEDKFMLEINDQGMDTK